MRGRSQAEFGIPEHLMSDDDWGKSCHHLSMIDERQLPSEKIHELLRSALEIFKSCGEKNLEWRENSALTADDYLPIHIYVVVHSGLRRPLMTKEYLGAMIHPSKMMGEVGYFLTMFEVALKYIADISAAQPLRAQKASRAAQRWLAAMDNAPCLSCGHAAPLAERVDCSVSGFPLTCSSGCADAAVQSRRDRILPFLEVNQDVILFTRDKRWLRDECALRLVSAAYTFVMTLSTFLDEATMPRHIWQELLHQHPCRHFEIKLVGDHVPAIRPQQQPRLHIENYPGLYHEVTIPQRADAFVLFNPGIGHPRLEKLWRPTLEGLVATGKPLLLTSFSEKDLERDLAALPQVQFVVEPQLNAFGSLMYQLDPSDVFTPIQTNRHVMVVKG
ncbi:hypothetical protein P43SY_008784 [Pythium insidiosum]|uniref:VPS9 domain-containing protein n=1 Tax=Pythium insidiosum TaxID=114742 RepID=A0AAD5Q843_PYTIN|nr:hypothetical protein P43SY_008784 [Pythium insidiosum]